MPDERLPEEVPSAEEVLAEEKRDLRRGDLRAALLLAVTAVLFALPFHVPALVFCTFLAPVPLFCAVRFLQERGPWRCLGWGFFFGFFYHLLIYHWLTALHPLTALGLSGVPSLLLAVGAYVGAAAYQGFLFALGFFAFGFLCGRLFASGNLGAFVFSVCFLLSEGLCSFGTLAMPWSRIALPLAAFPEAMRLASVLGPYGVDAIVLLFGALVAAGIRRDGRRRLVAFLLAALVLIFDLGYGFLITWRANTETYLRVGVVQTAVPSEEKWISGEAVREGLTKAAMRAKEAGAEVIVFPETVLPVTIHRGDENEAFFTGLSRDTGALIISGMLFSEDGADYNAIGLFDESGLVGYNAKQHLVPFGEYLPWRALFSAVLPDVANNTYYHSDYTPGETGFVAKARGDQYGGLVCFDSLFPELAREGANEGCSILCVCTNDAWFKDSPAAMQHLYQSVYRAVETECSVAVSANVGVSALIDSHGTVLESAALGEEDVLVATLPRCKGFTVFARTGELVIPLCAVLLALIFGLAFTRRRRWFG